MISMFETIARSGQSRIGLLYTRRGKIETPTIFPVHDLGPDGRYNTPRYWKFFPEINNGMFNASLISLCSEEKLNRLFEIGLRRYIDFDGNVFIDSGGYLYEKYGLSFEQDKLLYLQEKIGADIASTLDYPISMNKRFENTNILRSVDNAKKCLMHRNDKEMLLYASIHGYDPSIIRNIVRHLKKHGNFDGYAIGSMMKYYTNYTLLANIVIIARMEIGDKPLHVYGLSGNVIIPLLIYMGVESMDSSSFVIAASNKEYIIPSLNRVYAHNIENNFEDICTCKICKDHPKDVIVKSRELLSCHNVWALWREIDASKEAIREDRLEEYLEMRFSNNPWAKRAFAYAKKKLRFGLKGIY